MDTNNKKSDPVLPYVIVFAGPNGSGKTSLINALQSRGLQVLGAHYPVPERFINPDQVAKDLRGNFPNQAARDRAAFRAAIQMRAEAIESGRSFAFETVMSHPTRINEMLALKEQGFQLLLTFVTTQDPEKNVERVRQRYQSGTTTGHFVEPDTVRERYHRTLALLPKAIETVDGAIVYDNSADYQAPTVQVIYERDVQFSIATDTKEWVTHHLVNPLQLRERDLSTLTSMLENRGYEVAFADELRGEYRGPVIFSTSQYVGQFDEKINQAVIHDRLMLDSAPERTQGLPQTYAQHERLTVHYTQANAPLVERHGKPLANVATIDFPKGKSRGP